MTTEQLEVRQLLTGDLEWAQSIGGTSGEWVNELTVDKVGNVYVTGYFFGTTDFDPGPGVSSRTATGASQDIFVCKYNSFGGLVWAKSFGGASAEFATGIAVDATGDVLVVGTFEGTADFDPGPGTLNRTSSGGTDIYVVKLNSLGDAIWAQSWGSGNDESAGGVRVSAAGHVLTTGQFLGSTDFDPGAGVQELTAEGPSDAFVSRLDNNGNLIWARAIRGTGNAYGRSIAIDPQDFITVAGDFEGQATLTGAFGATQQLVSAGAHDSFIARFDLYGNALWGRSVGGTLNEVVTRVALDGSGEIYVCGSFSGTADFDPGPGYFGQTAAGGFASSDIYLLKLNTDGQFQFVRTIGGGASDIVNDLVVDSVGNSLMTGSYSLEADFDPGPGVLRHTSAGDYDIFVTQLDPNGDLVFAQSFGGPTAYYEHGSAIGVALDGSILIAGNFDATIDVDPQPAVVNLIPNASIDMFLMKLSPDMTFSAPAADLWDMQLRRNGDWLELWMIESGFGTEYTLMERHRLEAIRSVYINDNVNSGSVGLDFKSGGPFSVPGGINIIGGGGVLTSVTVSGNSNEGITWAPMPNGGDSLLIPGGVVNLFDVQEVRVNNVQHVIVQPQLNTDVITVAPIGIPDPLGLMITGTTDGQPIPALRTSNVRDLTIDTGARDAALSLSNDTVTFQANSVDAPGLKNVYVRTGRGNDVLTVNGPNIGLPVDDGKFWFLGGSGVDRVIGVGDTNWDLNDLRLVSGGGGRIELSDIERSSLTGGASKNHLNASLFSGDVILDGGSNNDLLRGGSGNDIIYGGTGNDRILGGLGDDTLYGQDNNDQIWGDAGEDTIYGSAGLDQLWGGDDNDWMSGDTGDDVLLGGNGDDILNGGDQNDRLFGESGRDVLNGGNHDDFLSGGADNDTLNGQAGVDLYDLQGTNTAEDLALLRASATSATFRRRPRGLVSVLELDAITMDASDEFLISALDGDDLISVDALFTQLGSVDGGNGTDSCTAPIAWTKISC